MLASDLQFKQNDRSAFYPFPGHGTTSIGMFAVRAANAPHTKDRP